MSAKQLLNLQAARAVFRRIANVNEWTTGDTQSYTLASDSLVALGWCPVCEMSGIHEGDGHRSRLDEYEPPDQQNYGGRTCLTCETFFPTGEQHDGPGYDTEPEWRGDADPGL